MTFIDCFYFISHKMGNLSRAHTEFLLWKLWPNSRLFIIYFTCRFDIKVTFLLLRPFADHMEFPSTRKTRVWGWVGLGSISLSNLNPTSMFRIFGSLLFEVIEEISRLMVRSITFNRYQTLRREGHTVKWSAVMV